MFHRWGRKRTKAIAWYWQNINHKMQDKHATEVKIFLPESQDGWLYVENEATSIGTTVTREVGIFDISDTTSLRTYHTMHTTITNKLFAPKSVHTEINKQKSKTSEWKSQRALFNGIHCIKIFLMQAVQSLLHIWNTFLFQIQTLLHLYWLWLQY